VHVPLIFIRRAVIIAFAAIFFYIAGLQLQPSRRPVERARVRALGGCSDDRQWPDRRGCAVDVEGSIGAAEAAAAACPTAQPTSSCACVCVVRIGSRIGREGAACQLRRWIPRRWVGQVDALWR
jgi:hypothetical protein